MDAMFIMKLVPVTTSSQLFYWCRLWVVIM